MRLLPLLLLLLLLPAAPAAAAPTWLPPTFLTVEGPAGEPPESDVALAPDGTAIAVWSRNVEGADVIEFARRSPGQGFGAPVTLSGGAGQQGTEPEVAVDGQGNATVVWRELPADAVRAARIPAGGAPEPVQTVSTGFTPALNPHVAVGAGGTAVATFATGPLGNRQLYGAARDGAGGTFAAPAPVSSPGFLAFQVDVAVGAGGHAAVLYAGALSLNQAVVRSNYRAPGGTFSPTGDARSDGGPNYTAGDPAVTVDPAGRATAAWTFDNDYMNLNSPLRVAYTASDTGGVFPPGAGTEANLPGEDATRPDLASAADGTVFGTWTAGSGDQRKVQAALRPPDGGFQQHANLSGPGNAVSVSSIEANARGDALVVWPGFSGEAIYSSFRPAGGAFGNVQVAVDEAGDDTLTFFAAHAALDDQGNAIATWNHNQFRTPSDFYRVQTASYDAAAPTLTASVPPGGVAGQPIGMAAAATDRLSAVALSWSFGDGITATGGAVQHAFGAAGAFTVSVTATDAVGNAATTTAPVLVSPAPPPPRVDAGVSVKWALQKQFTYLISMRVRRPPAGAKVSLRCAGKKCPFERRSFSRIRNNAITLLATKKARKVVKLKSRRFRKGQRLEVRITAPGHVGKVVKYTVRRGDIPSTRTLCLPLGGSTPRTSC